MYNIVYIYIFKNRSKSLKRFHVVGPAPQILVRELLLYLAKIIHVINGPLPSVLHCIGRLV